jgi:hypothetical protein
MFLNAAFSDPKKSCVLYVREFYEKSNIFCNIIKNGMINSVNEVDFENSNVPDILAWNILSFVLDGYFVIEENDEDYQLLQNLNYLFNCEVNCNICCGSNVNFLFNVLTLLRSRNECLFVAISIEFENNEALPKNTQRLINEVALYLEKFPNLNCCELDCTALRFLDEEKENEYFVDSSPQTECHKFLNALQNMKNMTDFTFSGFNIMNSSNFVLQISNFVKQNRNLKSFSLKNINISYEDTFQIVRMLKSCPQQFRYILIDEIPWMEDEDFPYEKFDELMDFTETLNCKEIHFADDGLQ